METMKTFLLLTTLLTLEHQVFGLTCSNDMKQGPFKLTIPESTIPKIFKFTTSVTKFSILTNSANLLVGYRSVWSSYCYNGGSLDPNTGCFNEMKKIPPSEIDLRKWEVRKECEICNDVFNGWGSDSRKCQAFNEPCNVWAHSKELEKRSTNNNFAYHTCELSWRCGYSKSEIPLYMEEGHPKPKLLYALPNGTLTEVTKTFVIDGSTSFLIKDTPDISENSMVLNCLHDGKEIWCIDETINKPVKFKSFGKFSSYCSGPICYYLDAVSELKGSHFTKVAGASLEDLKTLYATEMMIVEEVKFGLVKNTQRIIEMERMYLKLVNSLSKIDDKLLGTLLSGDFVTEYLNDEMFVIKPCLKRGPVSSNCKGNLIFKEGRWVTRLASDTCVNLESSKPISLFSELSLWLPKISEPDYLGLPSDYSGWSFIAERKKALIETMENTKNGGKGTSLEDALSMPSGSITHMISGLVGISFTTLVGFVIIALLICKIFKCM